MLRSGLFLALAVLTAVPAAAQLPSNSRYGNGERMPLSPVPMKGEPIAPFFEGWFRDPGGTFTFSFGYFNLSREETHDIPLGPDNFIEPAEFDGLQPTHFPGTTRRDRGVFHVTVPGDWEGTDQRVVWTITANGVTHSVPARVGYEALQLGYDPKAMGSVPPQISFAYQGETGQGIRGVWSERRNATVGEPMLLTIWGEEISVRASNDQVNTNVYLTATWFKHQGPAGDVMFEPGRIKIEDGSGRATTSVTFTTPGEYVLRARVDNWNANDSSGGDQCCWTNAFVPITVTGGM